MSRIRLTTWLAACLVATAAWGEVKIETVRYDHDDSALEGVLAYDDGVAGPRPGVLIVHAWWGRSPQETKVARRLAELGYTAMAIDMFGTGKLTDDPAQAREWATQMYTDRQLARDRLSAALAVLRDQPSVDPSRIAIIGYCFGGAMAFELAYAGAGIDAAVSYHGNPMPPMDRDKPEAKLLILHGANDPLAPMPGIIELVDTLTDTGADVQLAAFGGAQHSFTDPTADTYGIDGVRYDASADQRSWALMRLLFEELWGEPAAPVSPDAATPDAAPTATQPLGD
ncbi:MAG: dienelactone hydrolase family protein [Planctomycetota bacterium]